MNRQQSDVEDLRVALFDDCSVPVAVYRGGAPLLQTRAVVAKTKSEDADGSEGRVFANFSDFLFWGSEYEPRLGDVVSVENGDSFVVKPVTKELWRWDDPYKAIKRIHAQRRA